MSFWGLIVYLLLVVGTLGVLAAVAKPDFKSRVFKNPVSQMFEQLYLFIENMCVGTIGPHGRKYIPLIITFWLVIFMGNLVALFFPTSPTADLSFNLGMALIAVFYVQYEGIKGHADILRREGKDPFTAWSLGFLRHMKHFAGPKLGGLLALIVTPLIFVIEIVSELMKNVSLTLRLFGNINGGHQAVESMNALGESVYVPVGAFLIPVKLLTVVVQAMIFTLLTCVYLSLVTHHEEDHDHGHGEPAHAH